MPRESSQVSTLLVGTSDPSNRPGSSAASRAKFLAADGRLMRAGAHYPTVRPHARRTDAPVGAARHRGYGALRGRLDFSRRPAYGGASGDGTRRVRRGGRGCESPRNYLWYPPGTCASALGTGAQCGRGVIQALSYKGEFVEVRVMAMGRALLIRHYGGLGNSRCGEAAGVQFPPEAPFPVLPD